MNAFLAALAETYVTPFANLRRCLTYLGVFLGVFGFNLILIAMPLAYANASYVSLLLFYTALFLPMGLALCPLIYGGFSAWDGRAFRITLLGVQMAGFVPLFLFPGHLLVTGAFCSIISTVFWGMYHIAMQGNTTSNRRSYQVVLSDNLMIIASALAAVTAVHYTGEAYRNLHLVFACIAMFLGNLCQAAVTPFAPRHAIGAFFGGTRQLWQREKGLMLRILQRSLLATPDYVLPAVMYFLDYTPLAIGTFIVIRTVIQTLLSPIIATLIQRRKINEYRVGLLLCMLAWVVFCAFMHSRLALMAFIIINAAGLRILNNSITVRLYSVKERHQDHHPTWQFTGLMLQEFFLSLSRVAMLALLIPVLFWNSEKYIALMMGFAGLMLALDTLLPRRT